jgi:monovalent cation:H+ antiporter, CPA1 family
MDSYAVSSSILTLAILIAFINHRFIRMPSTIAVMVSALTLSFLLIIGSDFGLYSLKQHISHTLININFEKLLINGMLSFLLFAGALTIDIRTLRAQRWEVTVLATLSTILSTFLVGIGIYFVLPWLGLHLHFIYCLLFGALISPTDPIAVLSTFKQVKVPKVLDTIVAGESLFNDGVAIVLFLTLFDLAFTQMPLSFGSVLLTFLQQSLGGMLYGLALGFAGSWLIKQADDHKIEILLTLAMVTGGYTFAQALNISGPLAMVVAGIIVGSYARKHAMTHQARQVLQEFWELIDESLNCVLFLLIGLELLMVSGGKYYLLAAILAILLVLIVRFITVALPMAFFKKWNVYSPYTITILVWGGLRGGLAVALALSLPAGDYRELILAMTYAVVAFAIIIQGLTIGPLVKAVTPSP